MTDVAYSLPATFWWTAAISLLSVGWVVLAWIGVSRGGRAAAVVSAWTAAVVLLVSIGVGLSVFGVEPTAVSVIGALSFTLMVAVGWAVVSLGWALVHGPPVNAATFVWLLTVAYALMFLAVIIDPRVLP